MKINGWVLVVGAAGAGKTSVGRLIADRFGLEGPTGDLEGLHELVSSPDDPKLLGLQEGVVLLPEGGFDIVDPRVWDECLLRIARKRRNETGVVFEFARGNDDAYLAYHDLPPERVYEPSFRLLVEVLSRETLEASVVVHVHASFEIRRARNQERRAAGGHFVPAATMGSVYRDDWFRYEGRGENAGVLSATLPIPVFSFANEYAPAPDVSTLSAWLKSWGF